MKNNIMLVSFLFGIVFLGSGCASTYTIEVGEPPVVCGTCEEKQDTFSEKWGPVTLGGDGTVSLSNATALMEWYKAMEEAAQKAITSLNKKAKEYECHEACMKDGELKETVEVKLNPNNTEDSDKCNKQVNATIEAEGWGLTCALAYLQLMSAITDSIELGLDEECKKISPECTIASVAPSSGGINPIETAGSSGCNVTVTIPVTGHCGKSTGHEGISFPSASGEFTLTVKCSGGYKCEGGSEGMSISKWSLSNNVESVLQSTECSGGYPCANGAEGVGMSKWSLEDNN